ncbi:MAG: transporter substrate-binding domain-containing protein [Quinella sp. 2Q5]|nr:transporter substrate-binding domain-containing protein [Quinella sp. 2Q5]
MKKIFTALIVLTLMLTGCGSSNDKTVKVGTLTQLNSTPEQAAKISGDEISFYDNFNSMQMALKAQQINSIQTYGIVAKYMSETDADFKISDEQRTTALTDNFCLAVREDDVALKNSLDEAINAMKADGTLDEITKKFIRELKLPPTAVPIPTFDGARTIRVGVTGDLPPLDLVLADGTPAGFNTAVLAEIAKRLHENIELIQLDSAARATALTSGEVDAIFWVVVPEDDSRPKNFDTPAGVAVTAPYYQDIVVNVNLSNLGAGF